MEQSITMELIFGHFTSFTYSITASYIELKPKRLPLYSNIALCLDGHTWMLTGLSVLCMWIVLYLILKFENVIYYIKNVYNLCNNIFYML